MISVDKARVKLFLNTKNTAMINSRKRSGEKIEFRPISEELYRCDKLVSPILHIRKWRQDRRQNKENCPVFTELLCVAMLWLHAIGVMNTFIRPEGRNDNKTVTK